MVCSLISINKIYYDRDQSWKDFFALNKLKSRFIDWGHTVYNDETKHIFDEVGWSRNDYHMLLTWFFADEELYSKDNLEKNTIEFSAVQDSALPE